MGTSAAAGWARGPSAAARTGSCRLGKFTVGKLPLGEIPLGSWHLGKNILGKYPNIKITNIGGIMTNILKFRMLIT